MALTLKGNRTGRAASIEHKEFIGNLIDVERHTVRQIQKAMLDFGDLMTELKTLNPDGWEAWYDNNKNIPPEIVWMRCEPVLAILRDKIAELKAEKSVESQSEIVL